MVDLLVAFLLSSRTSMTEFDWLLGEKGVHVGKIDTMFCHYLQGMRIYLSVPT